MVLMGCRELFIRYCTAGFLQVGIPLVPVDDTGIIPFPAKFDDSGLYILIPKLVAYLGLPIKMATLGFFLAMILIPVFMGCLGFIMLYKGYFQRFMGCGLIFFLAWMSFRIGDVYIAYFAAAAVIPLIIAFLKKNRFALVGMIGIGSIWGTLHYIRAYSFLGPLVFTLSFLCLIAAPFKHKIRNFSALIIGFALPVLFFSYQVSLYKSFAERSIPAYEKAHIQHTFWHTAYLGFGFLQYGNVEGICWDDAMGYQKHFDEVKENNRQQNQLYEEKISEDALRLLKHQPRFVLWTVFAKIGILFLYILLFMNWGIFFVPFTWHKEWKLYLSLMLGASANALFGLIALPTMPYSLGFICMISLLGVFSVNSYRTLSPLGRWVYTIPGSYMIIAYLIRFL